MELKKIRKKLNYTQKDVAKMLGIPTTTYSSYEQRISPPIDILKKLARIFHCSIDELVGLEALETQKIEKKQNELLALIQKLDDVSLERVIGFALALADEKIDFNFEKYKS